MKHKPALYALIRLHAELGAELHANRTEGERIVTDMKHVEAVLRMLDPGFDVHTIAPRRRNRANQTFRRGECFRVALDVLRANQRPMTVRDLAAKVLATRDITNPTTYVRQSMEAALRSSLQNHEGKTVKRVQTAWPATWTLA